MVGNKTMCLIDRTQLNMQNNPISNIAKIVFSNGIEQIIPFTIDYINTLQNQIDSLNLKTKSLSYIENLEVPDVSPYYEKMTFNSNEIEFTGNVLFSGNTNIITTDLTNVNNNINILQQKTEGLFYHNNITTRLDKKLVIRAPMGDGNNGAHLQIINNHVNWVGTTVDTYIFSGCPAGFWSAMTKNRDTVYLNREPGLGVNNGTGGFVFTTHANIKRGLRVDCFGGKSEINCGDFEVNANLNVNGTTTTGIIILAGTNLTTTLNNLKNKTLAVSYIVVPGVPGFFNTFDTYEIAADNINMNGIVKINGNNVNNQISSLQAGQITQNTNISNNTTNISNNTTNITNMQNEQITQNTNISTNASNIISWVHNIDANSYNLNNVSDLTAQHVTGNTLVTNTLEVPSLNGLSNSYITTTNSRTTKISSETSIGNNSSIELSTHDSSGYVNLMTVNNSVVDFGGRQLNNYIPQKPTMISFSVKVTYDGSKFVLYNNPIFDSYLVNYPTINTSIKTIQQGKFRIFVSTGFYGGNGAVIIDDLHVSVIGLYKTNGDANHTILCGAPQKFLDGVTGTELEFFFSRTNSPTSGSWLESTGYLNIMFSIPFR
jgi:hypothetical protein